MAILTSYWILDRFIILITIMISAYLFVTRKFNYWKERNVFEIKPLPFFGNIMNCIIQKESSGYIFKDFYNKSKGKPYMGFYIFDEPCLLINDREIIKDILIKDFNYFCYRAHSSAPKDRLGRSSLLLMKDPTWRILRAKLTPFFTSRKLKKMFDLLMKCTINLDKYLDSLVLNGKEKAMNITDLFGNLTTDMIGSTAYGLDIDSVNNPECDFRKNGKTIFKFDIFRSFELFLVFFYPHLSRFFGATLFGKESTIFLRKVFWDTINHRIESGKKRDDLIDILIDLKRVYADQDLGDLQVDGDYLVAQAATFFIGGFETSSSTMSFTLYEIMMQPKIQDRLRKEIINALKENNGTITYEMVLSLPYLHMVISETLRKYPILTTINRETVEAYKVANSNLIIEKGMSVHISLLGLHYDPEYFPNPEIYDPERFSEENIQKIPPFAYMPFGEGPRKCIGTRLGYLQVKLALIKFLSRYKVTPCEKTLIPMIIDPKAPLTSPLGGEIWLNVQKINTNSD